MLATVLPVFKALADENRLRLLGLLAERERSVDELAAAVGLKAPTVSHHLARLKAAGLVVMRTDGVSHLYRLDAEALPRLNREILSETGVRSLADDVEGEAWARKVLRDFFEGDRLKEIPASRKKREVVLRWLAERFKPGIRYPERQVNAMLARHHPDVATLRRELIAEAHGLMARERGIYWRLEADRPTEPA
jgi:DNA-binding transcriptional ArsR family regulator